MRILLDSDFLVGLFLVTDALHQKSLELFEKLTEEDELIMTSLVKLESATVISNKAGMVYVKEYVKFLDMVPLSERFVDENLMVTGWKMFLEQIKKGSSFIDSMNLVVAKKLGCKKILSFDKFYPKELRLK